MPSGCGSPVPLVVAMVKVGGVWVPGGGRGEQGYFLEAEMYRVKVMIVLPAVSVKRSAVFVGFFKISLSSE